MSSIDTRVPVSCDDDDRPPPSYNASQNLEEVKKKPICSSFNIQYLLFILGVICILLGLVDMIVFYVIPNKEINDNKNKYPNYHFKKPDGGIIALHFLQHIFLLVLGAILILAIIPKCYESFYFTLLLVIFGVLFGCMYFVEALFAGLVIEYVKKEDLSFSQITKNINSTSPINYMLIYIRGSIHVSKAKYKTCYSKNGITIPVISKPIPPVFSPDEKIPDYFYLQISKDINMTNELFQKFSQIRTKMDVCAKNHNVIIDYYPLYEGNKLILNDGKEIPSKMKKPNAIVNILFGLGVYPELLQKSIPQKKYGAVASIDVDGLTDYDNIIANINCINIGSCQTSNNRPHL